MATNKIVGETVDVIIVGIFLVIFMNAVSPYFSIILSSPAENNLANLMLVVSEAYEGHDARYPLVVTEANGYNIFGAEIYLTQFELSEKAKNMNISATKKIDESCGIGIPCICLINILNCPSANCELDLDGTFQKICKASERQYEDRQASADLPCCITYQTKDQILFNSVLQSYVNSNELDAEKEDELKIFTLSPTASLKEYSDKMLDRTSCGNDDKVFIQILACNKIETTGEGHVVIEYDNRPIILFPEDTITEAEDYEIIELRLAKQDYTTASCGDTNTCPIETGGKPCDGDYYIQYDCDENQNTKEGECLCLPKNQAVNFERIIMMNAE